MASRAALIPVEQVTGAILVLRGQRVLLDAELAALYGVTTGRLNQQVRRNRRRFPADFVFQLDAAELAALMLQNATSKAGRGGRRTLPFAFTEHGAIMAATVLNSPRKTQRRFKEVYDAISALTRGPTAKRRGIGFTANLDP
ncbi:MAG TPA: ORF6N domain-containing protein [Steroidobacteraceae bacterium]|nr:ORF6N domain-containing protein [Steroidobacteraceae bacterium]